MRSQKGLAALKHKCVQKSGNLGIFLILKPIAKSSFYYTYAIGKNIIFVPFLSVEPMKFLFNIMAYLGLYALMKLNMLLVTLGFLRFEYLTSIGIIFCAFTITKSTSAHISSQDGLTINGAQKAKKPKNDYSTKLT